MRTAHLSADLHRVEPIRIRGAAAYAHLHYDAFGLFRRGSGRGFSTGTLLNVLYVVFLGVALYLLLPLLPGIKDSATDLAGASEVLLAAALGAEILSLACFSEVLASSVSAASRMRPSLEGRIRSGLGPWFVFRLAITGLVVGRLLPGGAVLQVGITLREFGRRGLKAEDVGVALAAAFLLVYGALGILCAAALLYLTLNRDVGPMVLAVVFALAVLLAVALLVSRTSYVRSLRVERRLGEMTYLAQRLLHRGWSREGAHEWASDFIDALQRQLEATRLVLLGHPLRSVGLAALAFGYWLLDALCLLLVFTAFGVRLDTGDLLVACTVAQLVTTLPFMPVGGLGAAEGVLISMFAFLDMGPETTIIPVLGYRVFNYWMPMLLAIVFYPTLRFGAKDARARKVR